jgi:hypothetical protein
MMRAAVDERLEAMNLLGPMDRYKARWTAELRPREQLYCRRGRTARAMETAWDRAVRPSLVALRDRAHGDPRLRNLIQRVRTLTAATRSSALHQHGHRGR